MTNRLEFDCQKLSKRPDMISQPSGHAGCSVSPPGLDESRGVGFLLGQRHAQTHARPGEVVEGLNLVARSDNSRSEAEPYRLCRQRLAGYKQPQGLHCIAFDAFDAFPRSASGKVQRHALPARPEQERCSGGRPRRRLLHGRAGRREQELVGLPQRGDTARRGPYALCPRFLPDGEALFKALISPHVKPAVQIANF